MRNHTVEIGDRKGNSFKLRIATPQNWEAVREIYTGDTDKYSYRMTESKTGKSDYGRIMGGNWRSIDKGFIRFNSGNVLKANSGTTATTRDLYLLNLDATWGMKLFNYEHYWGVNDSGTGFVIQSWVLNLAEGRFSWSLID